jgi:hypothetical protein
MSTLTPAQRAQYLEKAMARKALAEKGQTDENVEILNQLEIGEVEEKKKKRKWNDAHIGIPLKTSSPKPEGEVKSPKKKKTRTLFRKNRKDQEVVDVDKDLAEVDDQVAGASAVIEEIVVEANQSGASQSGGASPWDPLFDPEVFLSKMVDMAGNSVLFNTTGSDELARMTLGYELKGLLLNHALASRQKAELSIAKDKEALVEKTLANLEKDVKAAKER